MANSRRKCPYCKQSKQAETMYIRGMQAFCNKEHYIEYGASNVTSLASKGRKIAKKENNAAKRELNKNDAVWQKARTQESFNKMRKLEEYKWFKDRGLEPTCISCGNTIGNDHWCCGHFKTQGGNSRLRYDPINTYLQHNVRCNKHLSGDIAGTSKTHGYKQGLIIRFGEIKGRQIIDYCESNTGPKNWKCEELEAMRKQFNARVRELQQDLAA